MKKHNRLPFPPIRSGLLGALLLAGAGAAPAWALSELDDGGLSAVSGAGLVMPFEDFRMQMAPTSFIELTGSAPGSDTSFLRGDVRYYGLTMSRAANQDGSAYNDNGRDLNGGACSTSLSALGCATTLDGILNFSNVDNPYLLRVFDYAGIYPSDGAAQNLTVLEFLGPSNTDNFRWSFWGEIEAGRTVDAATGARTGASCTGATNNDCILQSQSIIIGKPATYQKSYTRAGTSNNPMMGMEARLFQFQGDQSLGINFNSRLSGDFRFSVNKAADGAYGTVPDFTDEEGLYFRNVNAFLPLGQLHYQAITLNDTQDGTGGISTNGNFVIELTKIPDVAAVYNDFYALPAARTAVTGCDNACQQLNRGYNRNLADIGARYWETHGYVSWGDKFPTCPSGSTNCLPGAGVSAIKYAGENHNGVVTVSLPALAVNATNFNADICRDDRNAPCTAFRGTAPAGTWTFNQAATTASTRAQVMAAGGISFFSKNSTTYWQVAKNQNYNQDAAQLAQDYTVMTWRTSVYGAGGGAGCAFLQNCGLQPKNYDDPLFGAPTNGAPPAAGDAPDIVRNNSPMLNVNAINLGSARIEGMQINHLKITSLGASRP